MFATCFGMCLGLVQACQYKTLQTKINRNLNALSLAVNFMVNGTTGPYPGWRITGDSYCFSLMGCWLFPSVINCLYITALNLIPTVRTEGPHPTRGDFIA